MQKELIQQIAIAVAEMQVARGNCDNVDLIDWAATVQKLTAELVASVITNVRNI